MSGPGNSYEAAGVSLERGEKSVELMQDAVRRTHDGNVLGAAGGFAGLYALGGYREPVLASTIDGVGTKVMVANALGKHASLGHDIVNHCANDVLTSGARPHIFLDYLASSRLDPEAVSETVRGAAEACEKLGIALVGGETAEMPGVYSGGEFDIVGVCVGAAERSALVTGETVRPGDAVIGLASSGLHTNGYTLARKAVSDAGLSMSEAHELLPGSITIGEAYVEPHRAYVDEVFALREEVEVRGMAHITGGGLPGNLPRCLNGLGARLDPSSWPEPGVFGFIRSAGKVSGDEMRRVFNLGVGFCVVVRERDAGRSAELLNDLGCPAWRIGTVTERAGVLFV
ncbi:phosphoribosylformylglycinamidine cyclo-ligase [Rubrobacter indicoceani]|uniref:phosphoribosylformylglycinamidine cyclo-ligase n=1 Tax=Rubrobacter indicoceani TaxID=2051957 RepID=UPI0019697782|nr:phosphoribosylformylglycinamidine cyclo-ligase [Rubrobacter indicoceani]